MVNASANKTNSKILNRFAMCHVLLVFQCQITLKTTIVGGFVKTFILEPQYKGSVEGNHEEQPHPLHALQNKR